MDNTYNLGNTISNGNTHNINSTLDMNKLYKYLGITQRKIENPIKSLESRNSSPPTAAKEKRKSVTKKKGNGRFKNW